jgi:hypothetical protein
MSLIEWSINYVKNKDLIKRELIDFKVTGHAILFEYKSKKHKFIISETLILPAKLEGVETTVVCLNTKSNLSFLVKNWDAIAKNKNLSVIFVNPEFNEKWVIKPYVHNLVSDKASLRPGLKALFDTVPLVS